MSKPQTKQQLSDLSHQNYEKLTSLVNSYPEDKRESEFPDQYLNRNIRDVLAHLHHWHLLICKWYAVGMSGKKPDMPEKGYTWKTTPELNITINKQYSNTPYEEVVALLKDSFESVQNIINKHTNEELFEKKKYKWTGSTSLGAYLISATSSHYDWAYKLIKKCMK